MKTQKIIVIALLISSLHLKTENIPGRTRNLNILRLHKNAYIEFSADEQDSRNIFLDLAHNCDNPNFAMTIALKTRPFATFQDLKNVLENPLIKPLFLKACKSIVPGEDVNNMSALLRNPKIREIAIQLCANSMGKEIEKNIERYVQNDLKELLLSKDSEGKSALEIVEQKSDDLGCILLQETFKAMLEIADDQEEKKSDLHEELNKYR